MTMHFARPLSSGVLPETSTYPSLPPGGPTCESRILHSSRLEYANLEKPLTEIAIGGR
jgi:hypothetical protein